MAWVLRRLELECTRIQLDAAIASAALQAEWAADHSSANLLLRAARVLQHLPLQPLVLSDAASIPVVSDSVPAPAASMDPVGQPEPAHVIVVQPDGVIDLTEDDDGVTTTKPANVSQTRKRKWGQLHSTQN